MTRSSRERMAVIPIAAIAAALLVLNLILQPGLLTPVSWAPLFGSALPFILVAMAQVPALIVGNGGLDLSVGPTACLSSVVTVQVLAGAGMGDPYIVIPVALLVGVVVGAVNGLLIAVVRIPPIVATLGTYLMIAALSIIIMPTAGGHAPAWLAAASVPVIGPIPGTPLFVVFVGLAWLLLLRTSFRRNLFAVGGDVRTAFTAGVPVTLVTIGAYVAAGVFAAVAGLGFVSVLGAADPTIGPAYTIISLAGAALGGVALAGGRGTLTGAALGGAVLFLVQNALGALGISVYVIQIVYGVMLILALTVNWLGDRVGRRTHLKVAGAASDSSSAAAS